MTSAITAFNALIDIAESEQCDEVEDYLREHGADVLTAEEPDLLTRLQTIVEQCHIIFQDKDKSVAEVEAFFFSVASLFHIIPADKTQTFVELLCGKIVEAADSENGVFRMRLLGLMFSHFDTSDRLAFLVLCHRVQLATTLGLGESLCIDVEKLCRWVRVWALKPEEARRLYLLLWEAYKSSTNRTLSCQILVELLKVSSPSQPETSGLVGKLVAMVISDSSQFIFDDLLSLEPIASLKSGREYELLRIFVQEKLSFFTDFCSRNEGMLEELGLDYDFCVHKMRLLTIVSLAMATSSNIAVTTCEVPFSVLCEELNLTSDEVERVVMEAIRLKLIRARINQVHKKITVTSSICRTFELSHWSLLYDRLSSWKQNLSAVNCSLENLRKT